MDIRHLGPIGDEVEIMSGREYDERSRKNIARWITAHIVPVRLVTVAVD